MQNYDLIIIGAGAAGLFCALNISKNKKVLILEKENFPGKKLLLSGSSRCNITHAGSLNDFFKHYGPNFRFLKKALKSFTNDNLIEFLKEHDFDIIIDKNGKIFPSSEKSSDVLNLFLDLIKKQNHTINFNENILEITNLDKRFEIKSNKNKYQTKNILIATGGKSYPNTGSRGDGYIFAENLGHTITSLKPSLTPVFCKDFILKEISGTSFKQKQIALFRDNKKINEHIGDFGFTHKGISGPGILDFSRYFEIGDTLKINFTNYTREDLSKQIILDSISKVKLSIKNYLKKFDLSERFIKIILDKDKIDSSKTLANLNKVDRNKITENLCEFYFLIEEIGDWNIAMATAGGVLLKEVYSKNMMSKICDNLFFAGEVLDIDGDTGGYNLQAAFSTAYLVADFIDSK